MLADGRHRCLLSLQWALGCHKGNLEELLKVTKFNSNEININSPTTSSQLSVLNQPTVNTFPATLPFPKSALMDLSTCHPYKNIAYCLDRLATATSHKHAFDSLGILRRFVFSFNKLVTIFFFLETCLYEGIVLNKNSRFEHFE